MTRLADLAAILRSKNAGPLSVTFDVMFAGKEAYERVKASGVLTPEKIGEVYGAKAEEVSIVMYDVVDSLKITIPRKIVSGGLGDDDVYGCQQQYALANLLIP